MIKFFSGGCRCKRVRYQVELPSLPACYACHCRDCQTWSGTAFSLQFIVEAEKFLETGDPAVFELSSINHDRISRQFACPICFTRTHNTNTGRFGVVVVRAGTLDESDDLKIKAHIWIDRKIAGILIPSNIPAWSQSAPLAELAAALS